MKSLQTIWKEVHLARPAHVLLKDLFQTKTLVQPLNENILDSFLVARGSAKGSRKFQGLVSNWWKLDLSESPAMFWLLKFYPEQAKYILLVVPQNEFEELLSQYIVLCPAKLEDDQKIDSFYESWGALWKVCRAGLKRFSSPSILPW